MARRPIRSLVPPLLALDCAEAGGGGAILGGAWDGGVALSLVAALAMLLAVIALDLRRPLEL